jgi:hypothetical protein
MALIAGTISDLRRAMDYSPRSLPPGDLPAVIIFTGPARYDIVVLGARGETMLETRTYLARLYGAPIALGIDGEAEQQVEPFLRSLPAAFEGRLGLPHPTTGEELAWVQQVTVVGDNGIGVLTHNGDQFLGIEFRIEVETYVI